MQESLVKSGIVPEFVANDLELKFVSKHIGQGYTFPMLVSKDAQKFVSAETLKQYERASDVVLSANTAFRILIPATLSALGILLNQYVKPFAPEFTPVIELDAGIDWMSSEVGKIQVDVNNLLIDVNTQMIYLESRVMGTTAHISATQLFSDDNTMCKMVETMAVFMQSINARLCALESAMKLDV